MSIFSLQINMYIRIYIIKYSINHGLMTVSQCPPIDLEERTQQKAFTPYYTVIWKCIISYYQMKYKPMMNYTYRQLYNA